jgi:hypothetical protein
MYFVEMNVEVARSGVDLTFSEVRWGDLLKCSLCLYSTHESKERVFPAILGKL